MPPITALAVGVCVCVVGYLERFFLFYFILQYRHFYIWFLFSSFDYYPHQHSVYSSIHLYHSLFSFPNLDSISEWLLPASADVVSYLHERDAIPISHIIHTFPSFFLLICLLLNIELSLSFYYFFSLSIPLFVRSLRLFTVLCLHSIIHHLISHTVRGY